MTDRPTPNERRALHCLLRYREPGKTPYRRITPAMRTDLLGWAATLSDEDLLGMRNVGHVLLRWIREHQPVPTNTDTTLAWMMKSYGWRVELFWNSGGVWFTARLVDRDGNLMPQGDPLGVSAQSPGQALADLHDACVSLVGHAIGCPRGAALEEPTPGYRNGNPARGEVWYTPDCGHLHLSSPISDTDGGHDDR